MKQARSLSLLSNAFISVMATLLQGMVNLAIVIYLARMLAPPAYGVFSFTWAVASFFGFLTTLGIPAFSMREMSRRPEDADEIVSRGLTVTGYLSMGVMAIFLLTVQMIPGLSASRVLFDAWSLILLQMGMNPEWVFSGLQRLWIPMLINSVMLVARFGGLLLWVRSPNDLSIAVIITSLTAVLPIMIEIVWLRRYIALRWVRVSRKQWGHLIQSGLPMGTIGFISILYVGMDTWILKEMAGATAVGYYTAAYRPIMFLMSLSAVYYNLVAPLMSRFIAGQFERATTAFLEMAMLVMAALVIPIALGGDVISHQLIEIVFGVRYTASATVFSLLIWSWSFALLRDVFSTALVAAGHEKTFAKLFGTTGIFNVGLLFILVHWGPGGTASALLVTQVILLTLVVFKVYQLRMFTMDKSIIRSFGKIIVNSFLMAWVVYLLQHYISWWLASLLGLAFYLLSTLITKAIPSRELFLTIIKSQAFPWESE